MAGNASGVAGTEDSEATSYDDSPDPGPDYKLSSSEEPSLISKRGIRCASFIGSIDYLHGAGHIRHMLLMGWGGEQLRAPEKWHTLDSEIKRSNKEIQPLGVRHEDARSENMLWNAELKRILFIDSHRVDHVPRS